MKQPKEKAEAQRLKSKFGNLAPDVVDEIIEALNIPEWDGDPENSPKDLGDGLYWQAVKRELK